MLLTPFAPCSSAPARRSIALALLLLGCGEAAGTPGVRQPGAGQRAAREAGGPFERQAGACRVVADAEAAGQEVLDGCARAGATLVRLLGRAAPAGLVLVSAAGERTPDAADGLRRAGERWSLALGTREVAGALELGGGQHISVGGYAGHEAAHRIATAMLFPADTTPATPSGYGSPLPDWLDESLALLTEPELDQRARFGLLFEGERIYALPLRRFLYMAHPALSGAQPGSQLRRSFYGQSLAFAQFVQERAGADGLRLLVQRLQAGTTQGVALTGLPGLADDGGALEQEWLAWLRARRDALGRTAAGRS